MYKHDYIPDNNDDLLRFVAKIRAYAAPEACARMNAPPPDSVVDPSLIDRFAAALENAKKPNRGKIDVAAKAEARAALVKKCREYIQGFLARNPFVTDADRREMGLRVRDAVPTPVNAPAIQAIGEVFCPGRGLVEIRNIHPVGADAGAKADYGVRLCYGILGAADGRDKFRISARPNTGDDLPHSVFTRKKKHRFDFSADRGAQAFFCLRYENSKGQAGPWGDVVETFVA
ncbi:hypothetical protein R80B4_03277 [Fibrobacteres bacterium R8-0-B4]